MIMLNLCKDIIIHTYDNISEKDDKKAEKRVKSDFLFHEKEMKHICVCSIAIFLSSHNSSQTS